MKKGKLSTIIIIALMLISLTIFTYGSYQTSQLNTQIDSLEKSITEFNSKYDTLNKTYEEILVSNEKLTQENSELTQIKFDFDEQSNLLNEANDILIEQNAELTAAVIIMQDALNELKDQNIKLISENNSLKEEINKIKATPTVEPAPEPEKTPVINETQAPLKAEPDPTPASEIVYWVRNGKVWHTTKECSSLQRSTEIFSGTIAESGKERVCSRCP